MNPDNGERYRRTKAERIAEGQKHPPDEVCPGCGLDCAWQELDRYLITLDAEIAAVAAIKLAMPSCSCWNIARDGHQVDCRLGVKVATGFTEPVTGTIPRYQVVFDEDGDHLQSEVSGAVYQDFDADNEPLGESHD